MTRVRKQCWTLVATLVVFGLIATGLQAADPPDFKADATFTGSTLTGWHTVGQADWKAQNGEIVAHSSSNAGGWLVMDKAFQDLQFFANVRPFLFMGL